MQSKPEFIKFLGYASRSLAEVVTCLYKAKNRKYITAEEFEKNYNDPFNLMNMIVGYRNKLL